MPSKHIITTHKNADFDAVASLVAATVLFPGSIGLLPRSVNPNVKAFLSIHKDFFEIPKVSDVNFSHIDRLTVVDTNGWGRIDSFDGLEKSEKLDIWIFDHHADARGTDMEKHASHVLIEPLGANITLMIRRLKKERKILTPMQATLFLAGLYEDTGNLSFSSTCAEDAAAAAYLLERKADLSLVNRFLRPAYGQKQKDVLFKMLQNGYRQKIKGYNVALAKIVIQGHVNNLALVVQMYRDIANADAAFGIFPNARGNKCIVIGRSDTDGIRVGDIMRALGGGGHPAAGSALLKNSNPDAVEQMILDLIQGNQQSSVRINDLMSFPVLSVAPDATMAQAAKILRNKGCTGLPVLENGKLVGVISRRDFRKLKKPLTQLRLPVKAFMSRQVRVIDADKSPLQAARIMVKYDIGRLPVVKDGEIIGIITRSDYMRYFYDLLPD